MELSDFYKQFQTQKDCIDYLEGIIWKGTPVCPYCNSKYNTVLVKEGRRHCNTCNTSFSVTVNTMFHKTKVDLQKWFYTIHYLYNNKGIPARVLADKINVTKDTALKMVKAINHEIVFNPTFITEVIESLNLKDNLINS